MWFINNRLLNCGIAHRINVGSAVKISQNCASHVINIGNAVQSIVRYIIIVFIIVIISYFRECYVVWLQPNLIWGEEEAWEASNDNWAITGWVILFVYYLFLLNNIKRLFIWVNYLNVLQVKYREKDVSFLWIDRELKFQYTINA